MQVLKTSSANYYRLANYNRRRSLKTLRTKKRVGSLRYRLAEDFGLGRAQLRVRELSYMCNPCRFILNPNPTPHLSYQNIILMLL
jgi:hypothetical protein